jgi:Mor family transcriptional regulator
VQEEFNEESDQEEIKMKTIDKLSDEEIKPNAKKVMQVMRNTFTGGQGFYDPVKKQVSKK